MTLAILDVPEITYSEWEYNTPHSVVTGEQLRQLNNIGIYSYEVDKELGHIFWGRAPTGVYGEIRWGPFKNWEEIKRLIVEIRMGNLDYMRITDGS